MLVLFHKLIVKHSTLVGVNQSISKFMDKDIFMFGDSGNSSIASMLSAQIAECCCNVRTAIERQGYESQLAVCNQTNTLVGTANQNTLALRDAGTANTNAIIGKLDQMQNQALQDKIDALRERNTTLLNQLSQEHQNAYFAQVSAQTIAPVNAALSDLSNRLSAIECKQPATVTVPYVPAMSNLVPVNYGINVNPFAASTLGSCGC